MGFKKKKKVVGTACALFRRPVGCRRYWPPFSLNNLLLFSLLFTLFFVVIYTACPLVCEQK